MTTLSLKTVMAALLAGSLAATAGAPAFARGDGGSFDPAKFQERIEKRVDKALNGTDATQDQKKQVAGIGGNRHCGHQIHRDHCQHGEAADIGKDADRHRAAFVGKAA